MQFVEYGQAFGVAATFPCVVMLNRWLGFAASHAIKWPYSPIHKHRGISVFFYSVTCKRDVRMLSFIRILIKLFKSI